MTPNHQCSRTWQKQQTLCPADRTADARKTSCRFLRASAVLSKLLRVLSHCEEILGLREDDSKRRTATLHQHSAVHMGMLQAQL